MTRHYLAASTVDILVPYNNGIVLIQRKNSPFQDCWAIPGGFLEAGKETLEQAAARELKEETNLETNPNFLELIGVYSEPNRDPRGHVISHAYFAREFSGQLKAMDDAKNIKVFKTLPENLAFDHKKIIKDWIKKHQEYKYLLNGHK